MVDHEFDKPPTIRYVPGTRNRYDYEHNVVVLDETLKDYPLAHQYILEHELDHARPEANRFVGFVRHELRTDLDYYFGNGEEIAAVREYFKSRDSAPLPTTRTEAAIGAGNALRSVWTGVFVVLSGWWMLLARVLGWFRW